MNKVTWMHADGSVEEEYTDADVKKGDTKEWDETTHHTAQCVRVEALPEPEEAPEPTAEPEPEVATTTDATAAGI